MDPANAANRRVGQTELREISIDDRDFDRLVEISIEAYEGYYPPPVDREAEIARVRELMRAAGTTTRLIGAYREGSLRGVMRLYDYTMRLRTADVATGGLGAVAVGLEWKRQGIARDMILAYLAYYKERAAPLGALYPFRMDFYRNFGFGYGTPTNRYSFALAALRDEGDRSGVRPLRADDAAAMLSAYSAMRASSNGLFERSISLFEKMLADKFLRCFGVFEGEKLRGYIALTIVAGAPDTAGRHELLARELVFESPAALAALLSFIKSQRDQYARITFATQIPSFHLVALDPRDGSDRSLAPPVAHQVAGHGLGIMYRVIDVAALIETLADVDFGDLNLTVAFELAGVSADEYVTHTVRFERGKPSIWQGTADLTVRCSISEFSSLATGAVSLGTLVSLGFATVSDRALIERVDRAFLVAPPQCLTRF